MKAIDIMFNKVMEDWNEISCSLVGWPVISAGQLDVEKVCVQIDQLQEGCRYVLNWMDMVLNAIELEAGRFPPQPPSSGLSEKVRQLKNAKVDLLLLSDMLEVYKLFKKGKLRHV